MSVGNYNSVAISVGNKKKIPTEMTTKLRICAPKLPTDILSVKFNGNSAGISVGKIQVITDGYSVGKRHGNSDGISVGDWGTAVNFVNDTTIPTDKFSL
jgi:hypothetical protein